MAMYSKWAKQQRGNPLWLFVGGVCLMTAFWGSYKFYYSPWQKRTQLEAAEEYAKELMQLEQERKLRE